MIMKRYIVSVSALLCGLFCVQAETLTLDECRSRALEYNKSLVSSRLQIQKHLLVNQHLNGLS